MVETDHVDVDPAVVGRDRVERGAYAATLGGMLALPFALVLALSLPRPAGAAVGAFAAATVLGGVGAVARCRATREE